MDFFDPKTYSDTELLKKMDQLNQRLTMAYQNQMSQGLIDQVKNFLDACRNEYSERQQTNVYWENEKKQKNNWIIGENEEENEDDVSEQEKQKTSKKRTQKSR